MSRTIILTGATGLFGKVLVKYLLEKEDKVIAVGRSKKLLIHLKKLSPKKVKNLFLIKANLMTKSSYEKIVNSYFENISNTCASYKIKYVPVSVDENFEKILTTYLIEKQKFG